MKSVKVGVFGCLGRMGAAVIKEVLADQQLELVAAVARPGHSLNGADLAAALALQHAPAIKITDSVDQMIAISDVIIDFTNQEALKTCLGKMRQTSKPIVSGTTGVDRSFLQQYTVDMPLLWSANMSIGINLLTHLVESAAKILGEDYDVEILEMHHRAKKDAPSGTAIMLGEHAAKGLNVPFTINQYTGDSSKGRSRNTIGFAVSRGGGVVGDHSVMFVNAGERIEFVHKAIDRQIFARGAVSAVKWLVNKPNGLYTMQDVVKIYG